MGLLKILGWFLINLIPWFHRKGALKRRNTWREVKKHQWAVLAHAGLVLIGFMVLSHLPLLSWLTRGAFLGELVGILFNIWFFRRLGRTEQEVSPEALRLIEGEEAVRERLAAEAELDEWLKDNA